jgi:hypothetical protein
MNERRFIELVNLYIDHEISASELEELENEVAQNAQRRQVYHQYCRLQSAACSACQEFGGSLVEGVDFKKYQILARHSAHRFRRGFLVSAGAVTAACLAVLAAVSIVHDVRSDAKVASAETAGNSSATLVEVFESRHLDARASRAQVKVQTFDSFAAPVRFASHQSPRRNDFLETVRSSARGGFQLSATPVAWDEDLRGSPARVFRSNSSFEAPELASFQFQR